MSDPQTASNGEPSNLTPEEQAAANQSLVASQNVAAASSGTSLGNATAVADGAALIPPVADTTIDESLIEHIKDYLYIAEKRFEHLLTGMENSTAAAIKHLRDAVVHLIDHVDQNTAKPAAVTLAAETAANKE